MRYFWIRILLKVKFLCPNRTKIMAMIFLSIKLCQSDIFSSSRAILTSVSNFYRFEVSHVHSQSSEYKMSWYLIFLRDSEAKLSLWAKLIFLGCLKTSHTNTLHYLHVLRVPSASVNLFLQWNEINLTSIFSTQRQLNDNAEDDAQVQFLLIVPFE